MKTNQRGLTLVGTAFFVGFFIFAGILLVKLVPPYMKNVGVNKIIISLQEEPANRSKILTSNNPKVTAHKIMAKYFSMNQIDTKLLKNLEVKPLRRGYKITLDYEKKIHYIANISLVLAFENEVVVKRD